ncbi:MAG: hypothetical protein ACOC0P_04890 [Planctomycetota bacterium]
MHGLLHRAVLSAIGALRQWGVFAVSRQAPGTVDFNDTKGIRRMKYTVYGADRDTGEAIELTLEARDERAAETSANRRGILVERVEQTVQLAMVPEPDHAPPRKPAHDESMVTQAKPSRSKVESGHLEGSPTINIATPRRSNSLGIAAVILGLVAILVCWIPLINVVSLLLGGLGLLLGIIGFVVAVRRKGASVGYPIAGGALCGVALLISSVISGAMLAPAVGLAYAAAESMESNQTPIGAGQTVTATAATGTTQYEWAVAPGTGVTQNDVEVWVTDARVQQVAIESYSDEPNWSKSEYLVLTLKMNNTSASRKIDYASFRDSFVLELSDDFGNIYKEAAFGFRDPVEGVSYESMYPGDSVTDVLIFEVPVRSATYLNLVLPASKVDGTGRLHFRLPADMIEW